MSYQLKLNGDRCKAPAVAVLDFLMKLVLPGSGFCVGHVVILFTSSKLSDQLKSKFSNQIDPDL